MIFKSGLWLKYFGHSNSLCTRAVRVIVNYILIGKYCLRFFPWEEFKYPCSFYPIESRHHILHECKRYNNYWNLRRNTIAYFTLFLEFNSNAFFFRESCHMQVHPSRKLHPRGDATSEPYKPAFHSSHLSRNTSYGGAATLWVFRLPRQRYSYLTQSSMTELLLSVSQHWNLRSGQ